MDADIAVAGGGIAGLEAALRLERNGHSVTVIDPRDGTTFYPAVHHVLGGADIAETRIDFAERFAGRNIRHVQDTVTGADPGAARLDMEDGRVVDYGTLLVAVGARTQYGSIAGQGNVHDLRFRDDTAAIRDALRHPEVQDVVIVGGGATGIEAAASLSAAERCGDFSITLLERADRLLPQFVPELGETVARTFAQDPDITVKTGTAVRRIEAETVVLDGGTELPSDLTVWAGGVKPHPVIHDLGLPTTDRGLAVDRHLRVDGYEDVYAAGDTVDYDGKVNRAFYAIGEAKTVAANIHRQRRGREPVQHDIGWDPNLIQIGPRDAVFEFNGHVVRGFIPYLMRWLGVEKRYMLTRKHLL